VTYSNILLGKHLIYNHITMPSRFQTLPAEILDEIFVLSENLSLPLTCRHFWVTLSDEPSRVRFCTHVIIQGRSEQGQNLAAVQEAIFDQKWFTLALSAKVEEEVLSKQERPDYERVLDDYFEMALPSQLDCSRARIPGWYLSTSSREAWSESSRSLLSFSIPFYTSSTTSIRTMGRQY